MRMRKAIRQAAAVAATVTIGMAIGAAPADAGIFYRNANLTGGSFSLLQDSDLANNYFDNGYWANDAISSVCYGGGYEVSLYRHSNYSDYMITLGNGCWNLGSSSNDQTSSIMNGKNIYY